MSRYSFSSTLLTLLTVAAEIMWTEEKRVAKVLEYTVTL